MGSSWAGAQSQERLRAGYVVKTTGELLEGYLEVQSDRRASAQVIFQDDIAASPVVLTPDDISGYGFHGGPRYESRVIDPAREPIFARILVEGPATLYSFYFGRDVWPVDRTKSEIRLAGEQYLLEDADSTAVALHARYFVRDRTSEMGTHRVYRDVLAAWLVDCPAIERRIRRLRMHRRALVQLLADYNACLGAEPDVDDHAFDMRRGTSTRLSFRGGLGRTTLSSRTARNDATLALAASGVAEVQAPAAALRPSLVMELNFRRKQAGTGTAHRPYDGRHFERPLLSAGMGARVSSSGSRPLYLGAGAVVGTMLGQEPFHTPERWADIPSPPRYLAYRHASGGFVEVGHHRPYSGPGDLTVALRLERMGFARAINLTESAIWLLGNGDYAPHHRSTSLWLTTGIRL